MATFTVRPEGIIRQPALTMPGNATGSEAACTALTGSQIRALCGLGSTDTPTFGGLTLNGDLLFSPTNQKDIGNGTYDPRTVRAATSVLTPLVNNASAALTLGNATYGVTVPGAMGVGGAASRGKLHLKQTASTYIDGLAIEEPGVTDSFLSMRGDNAKFIIEPTYQSSGSYQPLYFRTSGLDTLVMNLANVGVGVTPTAGRLHVKQSTGNYNSGIAVAATANDSFLSMRWDSSDVFVIEPTWESTGAFKPLQIRTSGATVATFATNGVSTFAGAVVAGGDISMSKTSAQGYIRAYGTGGVNNIAMYDDNTNGILSTSSGNMSLVPAGGTVAVTGGITASGVVSHGAYTVATLPAAGSNAGKMAQVTDSNVAASGNYGATVAAGGANRVKVFSDGTNWVIA